MMAKGLKQNGVTLAISPNNVIGRTLVSSFLLGPKSIARGGGLAVGESYAQESVRADGESVITRRIMRRSPCQAQPPAAQPNH